MKKELVLSLLLSVLWWSAWGQNVGINENGSNPDASAILHVQSNSKGLLIPRMESLSRLLIPNPADGLLVYDQDLGQFMYFDADANSWKTLFSDGWFHDADFDTEIWVEKNTDEDIIRFEVGGPEHWRMIGARLENVNAGNSLFLGFEAGKNEDLSFRSNTFLGSETGAETITGSFNTFVGTQAGNKNTGSDNTFMGQQAGFSNTTGIANTMIGRRSAYLQTGGSNNTFLGAFTAANKTSGSNNTFIGVDAGFGNISGSNNLFLGYRAGQNESGSDKLYIANSSTSSPLLYGEFNNSLLRVNGTLNINNAFSFPSMDGSANQTLITDGNGVVSWGLARVGVVEDDDGDTRIEVEESPDEDLIRLYVKGGEVARFEEERLALLGGKIAIGENSGSNSSGDLSGIYIGKNAGSNISSGPGSNVIIGSSTSANTAAEGSVGVGAGSVVNDFSVAIGGSSGASDFGVASGYFASADFESVAIGTLAGGGFLSVSMGYRALNVGTGAYNIAIGHTAMEQNISGYHNVAVGGYALGGNTSGYDNVAIGLSSLAAFGGSSHSNTSVGSRALINLNAGTYNTAVGVDANTSIGTLDNVTLLGANTVAFSNNSVRVGDTNVSSIGGFEDWTNFSDGRFKHQVEENVPGLDFVMALRPVTYQLNIPELRREMGQEETYYNPEKETIRQTGFIAQEVEQTAQDLGYSFSGVDRPEEESDGFYGLRYATFTVPLVKAVQEQQDLIDQLLQKIEALEARIETLENE